MQLTEEVYTAGSEDTGKRLDSFIASRSGLSRSHVQKLIKKGLVLVNASHTKSGYRIKEGDLIGVTIPKEPEITLIPQDLPLDIIWEDEYIVAVNKPPGMVVYPAAGHRSSTLLNALLHKCKRLAPTGAPLRPGVVHRLDKDTSGLIVFAKDDTAYSNLSRQFREREIQKYYLALIAGKPSRDHGEIRTSIGRSVSDRKRMSTRTRKGKEAVTRFEVLKTFRAASLVKIRLITGRTHQIRVHFASIGNPVLGDRVYGRKTVIRLGQKTINFHRQMLHASSLRFMHPVTGEMMELTAPLPQDMDEAIKTLSGL